MGDPKTVLEGCVKYRDRKKWKARWAVISKLSPVADCLHLQLYRDSKEKCKNGPTKASLSLEGFLGMETGFTLDKESNTMALICSELVVVLAFDSRELLIQWQVKIRTNLAEEQQFLVQISHVPSKSKLSCGPARLHLQDYTFCIVAGVPPRLLGTWPIKELRRFGVIEGKFCFEGGSLCGKAGEGLHVLLTNQSEELVQAMDLASKGKLLGKRKALSRKNSVLETSTRTPIHKSMRHNSDKCSTTDSGRPLLSSGSECSMCDACSEILRSCDRLTGCDESTYNSASTKASSCRIHYRWPSCMSRWGQSSTITTSDVESMDTVSVTLSDYQGASHSTVSSMASSHEASLLCLCDGQGTWPFNHCSKCGRQFYSRSSLGHQSNGKLQQHISPELQLPDGGNAFSPQWTMNAALPSPTNDGKRPTAKKDSAYQLMVPSSDRASLCSHTSRSSSTSTASSSGSEYSVPRNYLDSLYDKPKALHVVKNASSGGKKSAVHTCMKVPQQALSPARRTCTGTRAFIPSDKGMVCPCHEPFNDWTALAQQKPTCSCWNQLVLPTRADKDNGATNPRCSSANPSPSSSPKKLQNTNASRASSAQSVPLSQLPCTCHKANDYMHYAVPRAALNMFLKEKQPLPGKPKEGTNITENPLPLSEEYDVPKKFVDIITSSDMALKSSLKALENGGSCSCKNIKHPVSRIAAHHQMPDMKMVQRLDAPNAENMQMCTCQRLVLWAGSFVPCLGGPPSKAAEQGWQGTKKLGYPYGNSRAVPNHYGTICCEPPRTAELVMVNGKPKQILRKENIAISASSQMNSEKSPIKTENNEKKSNDDKITHSHSRENGEFSKISCPNSDKPQALDDSCVNYANLEFAQTLPLYENSNSILNRLESDENDISTDKPPLPPRTSTASGGRSENVVAGRSPKFPTALCNKQLPEPNNVNGSAYELMNFEKQTSSTAYEENYLMMQPVYREKLELECEETSSEVCKSDDSVNIASVVSTETPELPLRPFMPFSYPQTDSQIDCEKDETSKTSHSVDQNKYPGSEALNRRQHLINEDMELRSTRSNSLSELKKIVLLRKRSSSVDGKNNTAHNQGIKSNPGSPICSHKTSVPRKHSLFSKLNLRSKEKSMSTNEIIPPAMLPSSPNQLNTYRRCNMHRSADCLKINEDYANSDDDLSNDNSEISVKENTSMKRSSSVPCRSTLPNNLPSPRKINVPVIQEVNDLNKKSDDDSVDLSPQMDEDGDSMQRKFSFGKQEKPTKFLNQIFRSDCDRNGTKDCLNSPSGEVVDIQGVHKRSLNPSIMTDTSSLLDPYKSTTSSSSSDMSDFIESLSRCSRSSSTSSGSSSDYIRSDDNYAKKSAKSLNTKVSTNVFGPSVSLSKVGHHQSKVEDSQHSLHPCSKDSNAVIPRITTKLVEDGSETFQCHSAVVSNSSTYAKSEPMTIPSSSHSNSSIVTNSAISNSIRTRNHSYSPASSTSSLSTSPSITDYSSSSSGNYGAPITTTVGTSKEFSQKLETISAKKVFKADLYHQDFKKSSLKRDTPVETIADRVCFFSNGGETSTSQNKTNSDV